MARSRSVTKKGGRASPEAQHMPCFQVKTYRISLRVIEGKTHSMFLIHLHFSHQNIDSRSYLKYKNQTENLENISNKV